MEYANLGRTALEVSRLCLGTMNFGPHTAADEAHRILDRALEHGINFVDTANVYGLPLEAGLTESILGEWFAQGGDRRERTVLATKVFGEMGGWPNMKRLSALHIRMACEASLRRLRTDYIDLLQMHHVWRAAPWEEIWQAMEQLVRQGKVLYVGSSNFAAWHIVRANAVASERHLLGLVSEQSVYNLMTRTVELEVLPACRATGVAVLPYSPLAGGLLAGDGGGPGKRRLSEHAQARAAQHRDRLAAWEGLCRERGEAPALVAIAWLLANPAVTAPIIGPRTIEQLDFLAHASQLILDTEAMSRLDAIWPGPGGEAPEAYAW